MKRKDQDNSNSYAIFVVFLIGGILVLVQSVKNLPIYIEGLLTFQQHPITFRSTIYNGLLKKYVKDGLVDYAAVKQAPELSAAVDELKRTNPDKILSEDDQLAYWINAYNLLVVKLIADKYPVRTIGLLANDYSGKMFLVGGKPYAVQDIYIGQILPRVKQNHEECIFLVSQGAIGYPPLQDHEYDKDNLKAEAQSAVKKYIQDRSHVFYDPASKTLELSPFFQWTQDVYSARWGSPFGMVNSFFDKKLDFNDQGMSQSYSLPFDWRLNDAKFAPKK